VGGKSQMSHDMHTRLIVGLSARATSIMMKSGDFIQQDSNLGFRAGGSHSTTNAIKRLIAFVAEWELQQPPARNTGFESRWIKCPDFINIR